MMTYIYNDEDNSPMNEDPFDGYHNPTVYTSRSEMEADEKGLPFTEREDDERDCTHCIHFNGSDCTTWDCEFEPKNGCWNCLEYDGDRCHKDWNNNDESYYVPDRDDKEFDEICDDWVEHESEDWEDFT